MKENDIKKLLYIAVLIILFLILAPALSPGDTNKEDKVSNGKLHVLHLTEDYIIGQGDLLEIFVWRNEQLSRQVAVRPDGKISLPLIQDLQAAGFTAIQLKNQITRKLSDYIDNPKVSVIITEIRSYRVSVLGRVGNPGVYPITGKTTLVEAISLAGGFTEWAQKDEIIVLRNEGGKNKMIRVNYKKIAKGKDLSQNIKIQADDTIIVP